MTEEVNTLVEALSSAVLRIGLVLLLGITPGLALFGSSFWFSSIGQAIVVAIVLFAAALVAIYIVKGIKKIGPVLPTPSMNSTGPGVRTVLIAISGALIALGGDQERFVPVDIVLLCALFVSMLLILLSWHFLKFKSIARAKLERDAERILQIRLDLENVIVKNIHLQNEFYDLMATYFLVAGASVFVVRAILFT
ncbi:hypothetical protein E5163_01695 [Marinicauda algicola]|uniref:Uncharacterized protein n=1 Tax=Marinicauda algicola TaxID=2029849 RepID=A0A4S2H3D6_9PROT|nr:hypothetical protein [Marinicauda algicola]TGY89878.1 hypothetical protein E5163_01695 [Marinicauda algicola]